MMFSDNVRLVRQIDTCLDEKVPIRLGINKKNELLRLIYEIVRRDNVSPAELWDRIEMGLLMEEGKGEIFHKIKRRLMRIRYPSAVQENEARLVPLEIVPDDKDCGGGDLSYKLRTIFVEKGVSGLEWTKNLLLNFPGAKVIEIKTLKEGAGLLNEKDPVKRYNKRREVLFLVRNKDSFIKACPCTREYKRCGYLVLNIGFGCPMDCAYCYLQLYSNAHGLVLPANIEEYYSHIRDLDRKVKQRTRVGTGEFTDSLALDRYTGYSSLLIPFFRKTKNLVLELKTKAGDIENVLGQEPHGNAVISWSMNAEKIAENYEKGGVSINERLSAACMAAERGYKIGFHFDPIVYYNGWEDAYRKVVDKIFSRDVIRKNTVWISLGTLRYTPGLKQIAEKRFADCGIYYEGEFFESDDGKMRYPYKLRADIYGKMVRWIRGMGVDAWVYPCMEPVGIWNEIGSKY